MHRRMLERGRKSDSSTSSLLTLHFRFSIRAIPQEPRTYFFFRTRVPGIFLIIQIERPGVILREDRREPFIPFHASHSIMNIYNPGLFRELCSSATFSLLFIAASVIINLLEQRCSSLARDEKASISADLRR